MANEIKICKTCGNPKVSDGLDICFECTEKIRSGKIMTEKNKSRKIKDAVDNNKNIKVKEQIDRGFQIAEKWKQQRKQQELETTMNMKDMSKALKILHDQQKEE